MKRVKAFTLVELLVVVAIIALLVSILLPTLGRARELARQSVCATSVKGVSTGCVMYTNQNNDQYPNLKTLYAGNLTLSDTCGGLTGSGNASNLALLVEGGVVSWGTFLCPSGNQKELARATGQKMGFVSGVNGNISFGLQIWDIDTNNKCQITSKTEGGVAFYGDRGPDVAGTTVPTNVWGPNHSDDGENLLFAAGNVKFSKDKINNVFNTGGYSGDNVYCQSTADANGNWSGNTATLALPASKQDSVLYWKP